MSKFASQENKTLLWTILSESYENESYENDPVRLKEVFEYSFINYGNYISAQPLNKIQSLVEVNKQFLSGVYTSMNTNTNTNNKNVKLKQNQKRKLTISTESLPMDDNFTYQEIGLTKKLDNPYFFNEVEEDQKLEANEFEQLLQVSIQQRKFDEDDSALLSKRKVSFSDFSGTEQKNNDLKMDNNDLDNNYLKEELVKLRDRLTELLEKI
jgi:secreted trypsin-like serine protease